MKKSLVFLLFFFSVYPGQGQLMVSEQKSPGSFPVIASGKGAFILIDHKDDSLIHIAARLLQKDLEAITGVQPEIITTIRTGSPLILIGNAGKSVFVKQLLASGKLRAPESNWEGYRTSIINTPFAGVPQAMVISGTDKRGTAYGVMDLCRTAGVSPWYWWADVPVQKTKEIHVSVQDLSIQYPKIKYRGIFINDEAPALSGWAHEKFGGFNHRFYEKVFELMLRLKSNYLWPAMWGNAFYDDDPQNKWIADRYGIVIGTSHHEPLMRAHDEWRRYGSGKWNYETNGEKLRAFWKEGMNRVKGTETIVTVGMRGDGDEPMTEGTAIALLEKIVQDQRNIIQETTGNAPVATPQLWALYKEVQAYYDKGMEVPDDITLLLCDDNWGNIRKLPKPSDKGRKGGYGIYYHFDYVGGPRNYKWINTNNIARVWEQMNLAWIYQARMIWIVNVGDIKPMEFPLSFFLDHAWDPEKWNEDNFTDYYQHWAKEQFGVVHSKEIGYLLREYARLISRRKPELLDEKTYSIEHYNEAETVLKSYTDLRLRAVHMETQLQQNYRDAYFQLVLHPILAAANLHELYYTVAMNHKRAAHGDVRAISLADKAEDLFKEDSLITLRYHSINNGKWNHMMAQTHIGYDNWQQPEKNKMPVLKRLDDPKSSEPFVPQNDSLGFGSLIPRITKRPSFFENDGVVSMQARNWTRSMNGDGAKWKVIPDIGKMGSGITTFPRTIGFSLSSSSPHVEYVFFSRESKTVAVHLYFSPTLNLLDSALQFAVSIDNETPQIITLNKEAENVRTWEKWVADNIIIKTTDHTIEKRGWHVLKYWAISPAVILQKLVVDFGGLKPSYLGPPETRVSN